MRGNEACPLWARVLASQATLLSVACLKNIRTGFPRHFRGHFHFGLPETAART